MILQLIPLQILVTSYLLLQQNVGYVVAYSKIIHIKSDYINLFFSKSANDLLFYRIFIRKTKLIKVKFTPCFPAYFIRDRRNNIFCFTVFTANRLSFVGFCRGKPTVTQVLPV